MNEFLNRLGALIDLPALVLVAVMILLFYALARVQADKDNGFEFADMFRDENGKASAARLMILVCGAVSSWGLMYMMIHDTDNKIEPIFFIAYMAIWSGSAIAMKALEVWSGRPAVNGSVTVVKHEEQTSVTKTSK